MSASLLLLHILMRSHQHQILIMNNLPPFVSVPSDRYHNSPDLTVPPQNRLQFKLPLRPLPSVPAPQNGQDTLEYGDIDDGCTLNIFEKDTCSDDKFQRKMTKRNAIKCPNWLWPDRTVPYKMDLKNPELMEKLNLAIKELNELECVNFLRLTDRSEIVELERIRLKYLTIREIEPVPGKSCQASLGAIGKRPRLELSRVCTEGQILHELMHVLGFAHEHQRPDRDLYVRVHCERIMPNVTQDFTRLRSQVTTPIDHDPYDFTSIMHYRLDHFSVDGKKTLEPVDRGYLAEMGIKEEEIGSMTKLSQSDIRRIRRLYQC